MEATAHLLTLHRKVTDILAVPNLTTFARALSVVEEYTELASSFSDPSLPAVVKLLQACNVYRQVCTKNIRRLEAQASAYEHRVYNRTSAEKGEGAGDDTTVQQRKRRGIVFDDDAAQERKRHGIVFDDDSSSRDTTAQQQKRPNISFEDDAAQQRKRQGIVFGVDKGEHVAAALEALQLEEFLKDQEQDSQKKVHFSS